MKRQSIVGYEAMSIDVNVLSSVVDDVAMSIDIDFFLSVDIMAVVYLGSYSKHLT